MKKFSQIIFFIYFLKFYGCASQPSVITKEYSYTSFPEPQKIYHNWALYKDSLDIDMPNTLDSLEYFFGLNKYVDGAFPVFLYNYDYSGKIPYFQSAKKTDSSFFTFNSRIDFISGSYPNTTYHSIELIEGSKYFLFKEQKNGTEPIVFHNTIIGFDNIGHTHEVGRPQAAYVLKESEKLTHSHSSFIEADTLFGFTKNSLRKYFLTNLIDNNKLNIPSKLIKEINEFSRILENTLSFDYFEYEVMPAVVEYELRGSSSGNWEGYILNQYNRGAAKLSVASNGSATLKMSGRFSATHKGKIIGNTFITNKNQRCSIISQGNGRFKIALIWSGVNIDVNLESEYVKRVVSPEKRIKKNKISTYQGKNFKVDILKPNWRNITKKYSFSSLGKMGITEEKLRTGLYDVEIFIRKIELDSPNTCIVYFGYNYKDEMALVLNDLDNKNSVKGNYEFTSSINKLTDLIYFPEVYTSKKMRSWVDEEGIIKSSKLPLKLNFSINDNIYTETIYSIDSPDTHAIDDLRKSFIALLDNYLGYEVLAKFALKDIIQ